MTGTRCILNWGNREGRGIPGDIEKGELFVRLRLILVHGKKMMIYGSIRVRGDSSLNWARRAVGREKGSR